jgi:hypothetical protein
LFDHFVAVGVKLRRRLERQQGQKSGKAKSDDLWEYLNVKKCEYSALLSFTSSSNVPVGAKEAAAGFQRDEGASRAASAPAETRKGLANSGLQW